MPRKSEIDRDYLKISLLLVRCEMIVVYEEFLQNIIDHFPFFFVSTARNIIIIYLFMSEQWELIVIIRSVLIPLIDGEQTLILAVEILVAAKYFFPLKRQIILKERKYHTFNVSHACSSRSFVCAQWYLDSMKMKMLWMCGM